MKPILQKSFILFLFLCIGMASVQAAYLRNIPQQLVQPNGDTLHCFASGDEFYNYLHDAQGYTIVLNAVTGYYVYADKIDDQLVPTSIIAGKDNPAVAGLTPFLNISPERQLAKRQEQLALMPQQRSAGLKNINQGTLNNLVVFIRFSGESNLTSSFNMIENMFNNQTNGYNSMYNYFKAVSYNKLFITSTFYPTPNNDIIFSYEDIYTRNYYMPYSSNNKTGYSGDTERLNREHALLERAINYIKSAVPASLNIDYDNNGHVDNVCFVIKGNVDAWNSLLWPHRWSLYSKNVSINGKRVYDYNFQLEGASSYFKNSVLCHEMFHTLGAPDLYHYYEGKDLTAVGPWDVMDNTVDPPQHPGAYMKYKYGKWIDDIPTITTPGTYTLSPIGSATNAQICYKIPTNNPYQFYVLEYRKNTQLFETKLPGSGLLIYRINTLYEGNADYNGDNTLDEIYLFRPYGTPTWIGDIDNAHFSKEIGRMVFNASSDPYPFFSNGTIDNDLHISNITSAGNTIQFTYGNISTDTCIPKRLSAQMDLPSLRELEIINITEELEIKDVTKNEFDENILNSACATPVLTVKEVYYYGEPAIDISWNRVQGATSYSLYNKYGNLFDNFSTSTIGICLLNVEPGELFCYTVVANCSDSSSSSHSNRACATVSNTLDPCDAPVVTAVQSEYNGKPSFLLSWDTVPNATSYSVYNQSGTQVANTSKLEIHISNMEYGIQNCYTVVANCPNGSSPHSNEVCVTIDACDAPVITATPSEYEEKPAIILSWDTVPKALNYTVYINGSRLDTVNHTAIYLSNLPTINVQYCITVVANCANGTKSKKSNEDCVDFICDAPAVKVEQSEYNGKPSILLSWSAVPYATSYSVYNQSGIRVANTSNLEVHISNIEYGIQNCYTVRANCPGCLSPHSNEVCATIYPCDAPIVTATPSEYEGKPAVILTWDAVPSAINYSVYRNGYVVSSTSGLNTRIINISTNVEYCYTVVANCANGSGPHSNEACAVVTPACDAPVVTATLSDYQGEPSIYLEWEAVSNAINYSVFKESILLGIVPDLCVHITDASSGILNCFTVIANCSLGSSPHSDSICITPKCPPVYHSFSDSACISYSWNDVIYDTSGIYEQTFRTANECDSIVSLILKIYSLPEVTINGETEISSGSSTTLTASGALFYEWSTGDTTESITVFPLETTNYSVRGTVFNDCSSETNTTVSVANNIAEIDVYLYKIYPNPTNTHLTIEGLSISKVELFNAIGKTVFSKEYKSFESVQINTANFVPGLYLLKIFDKDYKISTERIMIQR